jgi:hypothetical protein
MELDVIDYISRVSLHILLLHCSDIDIMYGHEGHTLLMRLLQAFFTVDHLSPGVKELNNFFGLIDVVAF